MNQTNPAQVVIVKAQKSRIVAILLTFFLGYFGIQWFYLNKNIRGIISLIFCWTFIPAIFSFFHFFALCFSSDERFDRKYNSVC